jgi:seryl-tRNA synthetase
MTAKGRGKMYDINWIRENSDAFDRGLARRGFRESDRKTILGDLLKLDDERRATIALVQQWQEKRNRVSKEVGEAKRAGDEARATELIEEMSRLKADITRAGEQVVRDLEEKLRRSLAEIPNLPLDEVPDGKDPSNNVEHHRFGAKRNYGFPPQQHFVLGEALGQMDFETAAKLSGARFVVLKNSLARLERALGQFMLDVHTTEHGYTEVNPPLMVNDDAMFGTAQLPKFKNDQFSSISLNLFEKDRVREISNTASANTVINFVRTNYPKKLDSELWKFNEFKVSTFSDEAAEELWKVLTKIDFRPRGRRMKRLFSEYGDLFADLALQKTEQNRRWLIPTAEVPLTNLVRESIVDEAALPLRFAALTPCFRAEAGAAGKDMRGMIRQHQFDKVELVSITTPEQSRDEHERMLACAEEVLRRLDLHYRVVTLCTGDMGFAAQKTYDIEVWLPGQNMYREISSCSLCGEFQARRMNARYRAKDGRQVRYVHTLNGSGVAVGRALIAVMETYQQQGGSIAVPDVLQSYTGGLKTIERAQ